jgi:molybdenum cofactor cytidylyltransferase
MKLAAVVLAAGRSTRFGTDKLLADLDGAPLIAHALKALGGFDFARRLAVVRDANGAMLDVLRRHAVDAVGNPRADEGMGTSIAEGIAALKEIDGAFIVLGDMPFIPPALYRRMAVRFAAGAADIVVPRHDGRTGHPVLFGAACFPELLALTGDRGGQRLIASGRFRIDPVDVDEPGILRDIDRPEDLAGFNPQTQGSAA